MKISDPVFAQFVKAEEWRLKYETQKRIAENTALWLAANRQLIREKGCEDMDRLLEILDELEGDDRP